MDVAFIASFMLSFPAAYLADHAAHEQRTSVEVTGILARTIEGRLDAWLMSGPPGRAGQIGGTRGARTAPERNDQIIGNFTLSVIEDLRGWPLVTTIERAPARLTLDILTDPAPRNNVQRDSDDPLQREIERCLHVNGQDEVIAAWLLQEPVRRWQWWAWFPAFGAWWMMMFAAAALAIQFLRFATLVMTSQRMKREHARRAENKCVECGYDMTGLEFNERCPECGAHVW